jgi:hypothetical protein
MYYQQPPPAYPPPYYGPQYGGCLKIFLYLASFSIPIVGIIAGIIFMSRGDPESRALGRTCLILGIVSIVIACCVGVGFSLFPVLLAMMEGTY